MPLASAAQRHTVEEFITLFICGLVLNGKTAIWIRTDNAVFERRRMHALNRYLSNVCTRNTNTEDRDYLHFLLRLRNELSPGTMGNFGGFYGQFSGMQTTIVSSTAPFYETYDLDVGPASARSRIEQAPERLRKLAQRSVKRYVADLPRE
ncbi:MAG: hypothetical protein JWM46_110 [Candidatus Kaiserbacteria bacterium]|nr:hypothetical protein [Candidatus Kaiserbacteria bacterium]